MPLLQASPGALRGSVLLLLGALLASECSAGGAPAPADTERASGGDAAPASRPHVFWSSEPVRPDEVVLLTGHDLHTVTSIGIRRVGGESGAWHPAQPLQATGQSLKFVLPKDLAMGVFECELRGEGGSLLHRLNVPDAWWWQGDAGVAATPGGWLRVFGRSLRFGAAGQARFSREDGATFTLEAPAGDGYSLSFAVPPATAPGVYRTALRNGLAADWVEAGPVTVKAEEAWPDRVFNVMDFYGADAEKEVARTHGNFRPPLDRTQAILEALKRAGENRGGVVYFPEGKYHFEGELKVPPRTTLQGAGMGLSVLHFGTGGFALDGGSRERRLDDTPDAAVPRLLSGGVYRVRDMSLYLPRRYQVGISAGEGFHLERVRVRTDRYWIRPGQREDGVLLRLGGNCRVVECDLLTQGSAISYSGPGAWIARNTIQAANSVLALQRSDGAIVEDNRFVSLDPQAYINLNGEGRNIYYARNRHTSQYVHQSDFSFTLDGQGGAYLGKVASADGAALTLAGDPEFPEWAGEKSSLWRRSVVAVLSGRGAGQYRFVTENEGRRWRLDRPFDVSPGPDSIVSIVPFRGRMLVVGNQFEDANWVNLGYGSSFEVIADGNALYRAGAFLNYGLRLATGVQPSWRIQYLNNQVHEGHTLEQTAGDMRNAELFAETVTRAVIHRGSHFHADNSGGISIGGDAADVVVERCALAHPRSRILVEKQAAGVLLRDNVFPDGGPGYGGDRLGAALLLPGGP